MPAKFGVSKLKHYPISGARIYIPQPLLDNPDFPFPDGTLLKIEFINDQIILSRAEWWDLLDWELMEEAYDLLPEEIKKKIQK